MAEPIPDDGLYDFAEPAAPPPRKAINAEPILTVNSPGDLNYRTTRVETSTPVETETVKDVYLPIGLLGGGVLIEMLSAVIWSPHVSGALAEMGLDLTVGTAVMLAAMLVAAKVRNINLGKIGVAAYKLAAIAIAPAALVEFLSPVARYIPFGGIICWIVQIILFFTLLGALFDLDESDTWYCVCTIVVARLAFYFVLRSLFGS